MNLPVEHYFSGHAGPRCPDPNKTRKRCWREPSADRQFSSAYFKVCRVRSVVWMTSVFVITCAPPTRITGRARSAGCARLANASASGLRSRSAVGPLGSSQGHAVWEPISTVRAQSMATTIWPRFRSVRDASRQRDSEIGSTAVAVAINRVRRTPRRAAAGTLSPGPSHCGPTRCDTTQAPRHARPARRSRSARIEATVFDRVNLGSSATVSSAAKPAVNPSRKSDRQRAVGLGDRGVE